MKAMRAVFCGVFACLGTMAAQAVPNAMVETVQAPAWVERGGQRLALEPGMVLENRDKLMTGHGARVVVLFADGSAFKVGEQSLLVVNAMQQQANGRFAGGLDLKSGDLRLVSHDYREAPVKRSINVRFGEVTAAVRSEADLTGTAEVEKDAVALRDGSALLSYPAVAPVELNVPLQVYEAPRGQAPLPVYSIDRFAGATWALRTQPFYDGGTQQKNGRWLLHFGVFEKNEVLALHDNLKAAGFAPKIVPVARDGGYRYALRLLNLVTEREARSLAERLTDTLQMPSAEVLQKR